MDSKGFTKDPTVRIVPSTKFQEFLDKLSINKSMPETLKTYLNYNTDGDVEICETEVKSVNNHVTSDDLKAIKTLLVNNHVVDEKKSSLSDVETAEEVNDSDSKADSVHEEAEDVKPYVKTYPDDVKCLRICDLEWIMSYLSKVRSEDGESFYLHELLEGSEIILPENEVIKRNPVLEARCVKLRKEQSNRMYRDMTKNVDNVRRKLPEDTIAYQMKALNSHLVAILQFIFSVFAGFMFGFIGIEVMTGSLDFGFRLLLGVMCGLIVALAEIYFLAKRLNEDMEMEENIQLGGPPVLPNQKLHAD